MLWHSPASPDRARSGELAAWPPARPLRPDPGGPDRAAEQGARRYGPPGAGTGVPAGLRSRAWQSLSVELPHFDRAAVLQVRLIEGALDGRIIAGSLDRIVSGQDLFAFAVRSVGSARMAGLHPDHAARIFPKPLAIHDEGFLRPSHVLFNRLLHLLGAELAPPRGIVIEQQHVLMHRFLLSYASVFSPFRGLPLPAFVKLPGGAQMLAVDETDGGVVHMARLFAGKIGGIQKLEAQLAGFGVETASLHTRLISGHAVMFQHQTGAVHVVDSQHRRHILTALALHERGSTGDQFVGQAGLAPAGVRLPFADQAFEAGKRGFCIHRFVSRIVTGTDGR